MATQQIEFFAPSGLTLTVALYAAGNDTAAYTASAVVEQTSRRGVYRATFSGVAAGNYQLIALSGSIAVASYWGFAQDTATTFVFGEISGNVSVNASAELTSIKSKTDQLVFSVPNQVDANAMTGGGGSSQTVVISPSAALQNQYSKTTDRNPNPLDCPRLARKTFSISVFQLSATGEKVPVTMTGRTLRVVFELPTGADLVVIENGDITKVDNTVTFTNPVAASTPPTGQRQMTGSWSCREVGTDYPWAWGSWQVFDVAIKD